MRKIYLVLFLLALGACSATGGGDHSDGCPANRKTMAPADFCEIPQATMGSLFQRAEKVCREEHQCEPQIFASEASRLNVLGQWPKAWELFRRARERLGER